MSDLRELIERAVPRENAPAALASELRAIGRRRQRRNLAVNAGIGLVAVTAFAVVGLQVVRATPVPHQGPAASGTPKPAASRSASAVTGTDFASLVGTRWVVDLVDAGISTSQAYPGDKGSAPRALVTFGADHMLTLFYYEGSTATNVMGTWSATANTAKPTTSTHGTLRIALGLPSGPSTTLEFLINHLTLTGEFAMWRVPEPLPYTTPLRMVAFTGGTVSVALDEVVPTASLPAPWPTHP